MRSELLFMFNNQIFEKLKDVDFYLSLTNDEKQYIRDRFDCKELPKLCPVTLEKSLSGYKKMTDEELISFFKEYEIGEMVSSNEELDYIVSRIGNWLDYRPKIVDYFYSGYDLENIHKDFGDN